MHDIVTPAKPNQPKPPNSDASRQTLTTMLSVGLPIWVPSILASSSLNPGAPEPVPCMVIATLVAYWSVKLATSKD